MAFFVHRKLLPLSLQPISPRWVCVMAVLASSVCLSQEIYDSQRETSPRMSPDEAKRSIQTPAGFYVDLAASEPDVRQPIAMAWDARGRLWVAENYTYAERELNFDEKLSDRIIILEDVDRDGTFESRKVFWDQAKKLTSIEIGNGGVWALCPPQLLFIPDKNGDDTPDREPHVILDGFEANQIRHNFANGLRWGPDGWLYGRHGIQAASRVGSPDQPDFERRKLSCSIWRYHPTQRRFDVVCEGTTNPWGMDWDEHGHLFFINTVIGHLWHAIPGAHMQRMYGESLDPTVYELLPQVADHVHWDSSKETWNQINKNFSSTTDQAGGGHAHTGMMIYQGDNWPAEYRGSLMTLNFHGRRINRESLQRSGSGFVGKHLPDCFQVGDSWFRGIELSTAPDGTVYVLDWSDTGECHENDGVHRSSGRIYRYRFGNVPKSKAINLAQLEDRSLIDLLSHQNAWFSRQSRQILAGRAADGSLTSQSKKQLVEACRVASNGTDAKQRLQALWAAHACGLTDHELLHSMLLDGNEHVRVWAIKLLAELPIRNRETLRHLVTMLRTEKSDLVCLYLAGSLDRFRGDQWWEVASSLISRNLASDRDYPIVLWHGVRQRVAEEPRTAIEKIMQPASLPKIVHYASRRLTEEVDSRPENLELLLASLKNYPHDTMIVDSVLKGMLSGLRGRRSVASPRSWSEVASHLSDHATPEIKSILSQLGVQFGQGLAIETLKEVVLDKNSPPYERRAALDSLLASNATGVVPLAWKVIQERDVSPRAAQAIATTGGPEDYRRLVNEYPRLHVDTKRAIIDGLGGQLRAIPVLLEAIEKKVIASDAVEPTLIRQMQMAGDEKIQSKIESLWPHVRKLSADKIKKVLDIESTLKPEVLAQADLPRGRGLWNRNCASCHRLFGEGATIGPELTGAQRSNLRYVLENVIDPSATLIDRFKVTLFLLNEGKVISGVVLQENDKTVSVQTAKEVVALAKDEIQQRKPSDQSLMPDGLFDPLDQNSVRDLVAYVMSPRQVEAKSE